jgi:chromosome partitioning protein
VLQPELAHVGTPMRVAAPRREVPLSIVDTRPLAGMVDAMRRALHRKVIVITNGKGGVGKSSLASSFAATCAGMGNRVLLVEMDHQGNNAEDLGFIRQPEIADAGQSQAQAVLDGTPMEPTGEARRRLWVAPGGEHLQHIIQELYVQQRTAEATGDSSWLFMYAAALAQAAHHYDQIILDVAPGSPVLLLQALIAGDMVVIPSRSDTSSRKGLREVARRFADAHPFNPDLALLGIVLFGTGTRATRVQQRIREQLAADVGHAASVFDTPIRHVEAVAVACRAAGLVPDELARDEELDPSLRASARGLRADYRAITVEILKAVALLTNPEPAR